MRVAFYLCTFIALRQCIAYLDFQLSVNRTENYISYALPIKINSLDYEVSLSLCDCKEFLRPVSEKTVSHKKKKHKGKAEDKEMMGLIQASSFEGYSFEGWKRFFLEALFFFDSRYNHDIVVDLSGVYKKSLGEEEPYHDGVIKFGPNLLDNKMFQLIKNQSEFVRRNVVSVYRGVNDRNVRLQLGGF
jgi:hypothetical protein